ncbi:MAG: class I SAM-dependent rRNA methyltransferase [Acidobacteriota bacterium]
MERLILKPREEGRLRAGHLWVFSNEVAVMPRESQAGDLVEVTTGRGESLGSALFHPHSLISARLVGAGIKELDTEFFRQRIAQAARLREQVLPEEDSYRLVYGESDFLPGLVIDRYGDDFVLQIFSAGMERCRDRIVEALTSLFRVRTIVERNDVDTRRLEELPSQKGVLVGDLTGPVEIRENGIRYRIDLLEGQKTGFFLDQKLNRRAAGLLCRNRRVLDCYCNAGGFGLNAARSGAASIVGVDASGPALEAARRNAALNDAEIQFEQSEVFRYLSRVVEEGRRFDAVILDPPSFAPRKKDVSKARKAYQKLNELGLQVLEPEGLLVTASCSFHLREDVFYQIVRQSAERCGRRLQLIERRQQAPDHPVHPSMPETAYLKLGVFRVL